MTFVAFLEGFKLYGPLGILAAVAGWGCWHLYSNARKDQTAHEKRCAACKSISDAVSDERLRVHHEQMTEMTNRFVTLHEQAATENRELTQQVRALLETVTRKRG